MAATKCSAYLLFSMLVVTQLFSSCCLVVGLASSPFPLGGVPKSRIRNFSIIAHINHGKSTLCDAILSHSANPNGNPSLPSSELSEHFDSLAVERNHGITIKSRTSCLPHRLRNQQNDESLHMLNLLDTPGHIDFTTEVTNSLLCSDLAVVLVDINQGVEAQTVEVHRRASSMGVPILVALTKVDGPQFIQPPTSPSAEPSLTPYALSRIEELKYSILEQLGEDCTVPGAAGGVLCVSGKSGFGVSRLLDEVCLRGNPPGHRWSPPPAPLHLHPPPSTPSSPAFKALVFDAHHNPFLGVVLHVAVLHGELRPSPSQRARLLAGGHVFQVAGVGKFSPAPTDVPSLREGEVGFVHGQLRATVAHAQASEIAAAAAAGESAGAAGASIIVGDVLLLDRGPTYNYFADEEFACSPWGRVVPGGAVSSESNQQQPSQSLASSPHLPTVYCSLYPADQTKFPALRIALRNLAMNDAALQAPTSVSPTSSPALGFGFRVGFSGMLHMEIVRERLCDEFGVEVILAQPSVGVIVEKRRLSSGEVLSKQTVEEASAFPTSAELAVTNGVVAKLMEPRATVEVTAPTQFDGDVIKLGLDRRGEILDHRHIGGGESGPSSSLRSVIVFDMPLSGVIGTLFDKLKSATKGYGSMSYVVSGYKEADLVRVEVWVNDEEVGPLATVCHRSESVRTGRKLVDAVREHVEREMFAVKIQARVGGKVVASEALSAIRKDVTAKCYGGDISRKKKLLKKQAEGKKRMRRFGKVEVGIDCFKEILKLDIDG